ncbi:hypothetical protein PM082_022642 [Marasmius tenuissimus]|nr:hypothetical protein PM082_022642 [Marasmius tenuissimus]
MQRIVLFTLFSSLVLVLLLLRRVARRGRPPCPPGPKGWPIIGDLKALQPKDNSPGSNYRWERYVDWSRQYNSPHIVSIPVFGERLIILNSKKAVDDLLDKRSAKYSDRPAMRMTNELSGWAWDFAHMRHSDWWRLHRKTFHQQFQPRAMPQYYDIQRAATDSLIGKLTTTPGDFYDHIRHHAASIALKISHGYQPQTSMSSDPYVKLANNAVEGLIETAVPGTFLVDFFPALQYIPSWLPGAGFKRKARLWKRYCHELRDRPWEWFQSALAEGTAEPSFATRTLEKLAMSATKTSDQDRKMMEEVIKNCAGITYLAGSDTTVSVMLSFVLSMINHPEVQARAQAEVDSFVASSGKLPDFGDQDKLPYLEAVIAETLRHRPVAPYAVPHAVEEDDVYEGFWIPKGSTVIGNAWGVLHDKDVYGPEPLRFNPDRFMKEGDKDIPPHPEKYAFGFGRRLGFSFGPALIY